MKSFLKVISLIIAMSLILCGCDNEVVNPEENISETESNKIIDNIETSEVGFFNGEYNDKNIVLKVNNNNNKPVYLNYSFEVFDNKKNKLFNKEVIVRVGAKDSAYVIGIQDLEEPSFDSYSYKISLLNESLDDYESIKKTIKADYNDNGKIIKLTFNNTGYRSTTVYGVLLFYKSKKLVAVKEVTAYNLKPHNVEEIKVDYPIKKANQKISFDKIEFVVNEVSTEL